MHDCRYRPSIRTYHMHRHHDMGLYMLGRPGRILGRNSLPVFSNASFKRDEQKGNEVALKVLEILEHFRKLNPNLLFGLENPYSSLLRKQDFMQGFEQRVLDYCCYATVPDFGYKKRTVIFGNIHFKPKLCPGPGKCENMVGKYHLCTAQQGRQLLSRAPLQQETWTRKQLYRYPPKLCDEIVQAIRNTPP